MLIIEQELVQKLNVEILAEESLFLQKARVKWMGLGDGNNSFFHQQCKVNWNHNKILSLMNDQGEMVHEQTCYAKVAVDFFQGLLGSTPSDSLVDLSNVNCMVLNDTQGELLQGPVTDNLILATLKTMKKSKALGPDQVNMEFFLATWEIIGPSSCAAVKHFFTSCDMPSVVNSTFISFIPKTVSPTKMQDFRPISLCTVMYKCISKIIASRLKKILPSIVKKAQSAFIPGRSISDNILLAQELFHGYDRDTGASKCALKIDLHKAFDSLNWNFILAVLHKI